MSKSFQDWLAEGEQIYQQTLSECRQLESQLEAMESRLTAKREELGHLAQVMGKSPGAFTTSSPAAAAAAAVVASGTGRSLNAELIDTGGPRSVPNSPSSIARALTGRGIGRYVPPPPPASNAV